MPHAGGMRAPAGPRTAPALALCCAAAEWRTAALAGSRQPGQAHSAQARQAAHHAEPATARPRLLPLPYRLPPLAPPLCLHIRASRARSPPLCSAAWWSLAGAGRVTCTLFSLGLYASALRQFARAPPGARSAHCQRLRRHARRASRAPGAARLRLRAAMGLRPHSPGARPVWCHPSGPVGAPRAAPSFAFAMGGHLKQAPTAPRAARAARAGATATTRDCTASAARQNPRAAHARRAPRARARRLSHFF